jgi:hypothetical protein
VRCLPKSSNNGGGAFVNEFTSMNLGVAGSEVQTDSPKNNSSEFDFIIFNKISTQVVKKKKFKNSTKEEII